MNTSMCPVTKRAIVEAHTSFQMEKKGFLSVEETPSRFSGDTDCSRPAQHQKKGSRGSKKGV